MSTLTFRVSFSEWQDFAINLSAADADEAIALAQDIRHNRGTKPFEQIQAGDTDWEARALEDADRDTLNDLIQAAENALRFLEQLGYHGGGATADARLRAALAKAKGGGQ